MGFLKQIYTEDLLISDDEVLRLVKEKFPNSKSKRSTIATWKSDLRKLGLKIPLRRIIDD